MSRVRMAAAIVTLFATVAGFATIAPAAAAPGTGALGGWVTNGSGIAGLTVLAYNASGRVAATTTSDDGGNYLFDALPKGTYRVCVDGKNLSTADAPLGYAFACYRYGGQLSDAEPVQVLPGLTADAGLSVTPAAVVSGRVRDTAGHPLGGVPVTVAGLVTTTDSSGAYRIRVRRTTTTVCAAGATVTGPTSQLGYLNGCFHNANGSFLTLSSSVPTKGIDVTLTPAGGISGRVVDQSGRPLAHVRVQLDGVGVVPAETDASGRYLLRGLDPSYRSEVRFDTADATGGSSPTGYIDACFGGSTCRTVVPRAGVLVTGVDATVSPAGALSGRVVDKAGRPIGGLWVYLGGYHLADSGIDGSWRVDRVAPGSTTVCVRNITRVTGADPDGYQDRCWKDKRPGDPTPITVHGGAETSGIKIVLTGNGGIAGRLLDAGGRPVAAADITWQSDGGLNSSRTAADGTYRVGRLGVGTYTPCITVDDSTTPSGLAPLCTSTSVTVGDNTTAKAPTLVMSQAASVSGVVTDDSGTPLSGLEVTVDGINSTTNDTVSTAQDGTYTVRGLPPGSYTVCFDPRFAFPNDPSNRTRTAQCWDSVEGSAAPTPVAVAAGATVTGIDATIHPSTEITGVVTDKQGNLLSNVWIELDGGQLTSTDWTGHYLLEDVAPGTHTLCFRGAGAYSDSASGFQDRCWYNRIPGQAPTPLVVPAHQQVVADAKLPLLSP